MEIIKSLNLNVTPKDAPNGSLVYARNVMTDDTSSFLTNDIGFNKVLDFKHEERIIGIIPCSEEIVIFTYRPAHRENDVDYTEQHQIYRLPDNGNQDDLVPVQSNWKWSGGKINGTYTYNYKGELIIAIAEYDADNIDVPLKSINLDNSSYNDKFTYATEEIVPKHFCTYSISTNGNLVCGSYTFFIRYKIDDYNYTKWFQVTTDIFVTNIVDKGSYIHSYLVGDNDIATKVRTNNLYINDDQISPYSIKLDLHFESIEGADKPISYDTFQLGYIIKVKSDVQGRIKGEYNIKNKKVSCVISDNEYNAEVSIDELVESPNQKFNVRNIINYNNRLYIANYKDYEIKEEDGEGAFVDISHSIFDYTETDDQGGESITVAVVNLKYDLYSIRYGDSSYNYVNTSRKTEVLLEGLRINQATHCLVPNSKTAFLNALKENIYCIFRDNSNEFIKFTEDTGYNNYFFVQNVVNGDGSNAICILNKINDDTINPSDGWDWDFNIKNNIDIYVTDRQISILYNDGTTVHEYILWKDVTEENNARLCVLIAGKVNGGKAWIFGDRGVSLTASPYDYMEGTPMPPMTKVAGVKFTSGDSSSEEEDDEDNFGIDTNKYKNRTLIPYQKYNFFIHYIRKDGSATLGYPISDDLISKGITTVVYTDRLIPKFNVKELPSDDYVGYFISYENVTINSQNIWVISADGTITSVEFIYDTGFISGSVIKEADSHTANIISSSISVIIDRLNCNRIKLTTDSALHDRRPAFIIRNIDSQYSSETKVLFRLTRNIYEINKDIEDSDYLPGFLNTQYFFVFNKNIILDPFVSKVFNGKTGEATDYSVLLENPLLYTHLPIYTMNIKADYLKASVVLEKADGQTDTKKIELVINNVVPPSALHDFLELQPAYSAKPNKLFTNFRRILIDTFDKTVSRSDVISDESLVNGFRRFDAKQYKNILENKGKITNIVAIGLYFVVHTEYSIFVFDRSPKLSQYAQTEIPDTFDVDYQELMPTNEGYGGLVTREESILTKGGYIWFDKHNKLIFSFEKGKPAILSNAINNYIKQLEIKSCRFAEDIIHNRLIICFEIQGNKYLTLSYNLTTKQFISFHDYKFTHNYKTYNISYVFDDNKPAKLFAFDDKKQLQYHDLGLDDNHLINVGDDTSNILEHASVIDIIFNEEFELPKVLNSINYVLSKFNHNDAVYLPQILREYDDRLFPGDYVKIYTDEVITDVINVKDTKQNVNDYETYTKPKWEKGKWNLNYFRDIHHVNQQIGYTSDQESLVFGKYFVVRFIFENDVNNPTRFKLDNVNVNFELY